MHGLERREYGCISVQSDVYTPHLYFSWELRGLNPAAGDLFQRYEDTGGRYQLLKIERVP